MTETDRPVESEQPSTDRPGTEQSNGPSTRRAPAEQVPLDHAVPPDAEAFACPECGEPFARERHRRLHRGLAHYDALDESAREAYAEAYAAEEGDIRRFRIVALGALVLIYFGFLFAYAVFAT